MNLKQALLQAAGPLAGFIVTVVGLGVAVLASIKVSSSVLHGLGKGITNFGKGIGKMGVGLGKMAVREGGLAEEYRQGRAERKAVRQEEVERRRIKNPRHNIVRLGLGQDEQARLERRADTKRRSLLSRETGETKERLTYNAAQVIAGRAGTGEDAGGHFLTRDGKKIYLNGLESSVVNEAKSGRLDRDIWTRAVAQRLFENDDMNAPEMARLVGAYGSDYTSANEFIDDMNGSAAQNKAFQYQFGAVEKDASGRVVYNQWSSKSADGLLDSKGVEGLNSSALDDDEVRAAIFRRAQTGNGAGRESLLREATQPGMSIKKLRVIANATGYGPAYSDGPRKNPDGTIAIDAATGRPIIDKHAYDKATYETRGQDAHTSVEFRRDVDLLRPGASKPPEPPKPPEPWNRPEGDFGYL